ncbi:bifunctional folylpolyglutamate synthase/dihydrofolate synthase [Spiroplasma eriocheiris]|uniref:Folylpolyglutamate synthase n=1 Tax=Spiroplasma eriocheiris TaxID=315358 RepID=A0A0H3XKX7_9MOLU|nr:Mur ligase family protein [Spiroplasma eriocheiris]AHF58169.1 putative folylpolyglutamate synthase [Spiroplasma eriocheiris CCTCC M 207170]AKM54606.1 folylpolyglutamate synthase [Spiroplasma eriocheiris]
MKVQKKIVKAQPFQDEYQLSKLLSEKYDNIQNKIKVINVVGTNGKGSTSNYLQKQLIPHYEQVGLFTSPAFLNHNERIKVNNDYISDDDLKRLLKKIHPDVQAYHLTFFEIWTLLAILYFIEKDVKIAIIEAGIGGVRDATNVFANQLLVALTSIGFDHTEVLGTTLEEIITNKVKIVKNNNPLIISNSCKKYLKTISKYVNKEQIIISDKYLKAINYYQQYNVGLVIKIMEFLKLTINYEIFKIIPLLGRFTILNKNPYFIIDGAHNPEGINALIQTFDILDIDNDKETLVLFASSSKKNYLENLKLLKNHFNSKLYITTFKHPLAWNLKDVNFNNKVYNWKKFIIQNQDKNILVCGSLYFIPLVYSFYLERTWK